MPTDDQKHPTLDNEIKINLPLDRQVWIRDTLGCKQGIKNRIQVKSNTENIVIENTLDQSGNNELKVYKNDQLVKHLVNGVKKVDVHQGIRSEANTQSDGTQNNDNKPLDSDNKEQKTKPENKKSNSSQ